MKKIYKKLLCYIITVTFTLTYMTLFKSTNSVHADEAGHLVISKLYTSGNASVPSFSGKYVELFNPTDKCISINGYSIQCIFTDSSNIVNSSIARLPNVTINPKHYYLILLSIGSSSSTVDRTFPDLKPDLDVLDKYPSLIFKLPSTGQIALCKDTIPFKSPSDPNVVDFLGYGSKAAMSENSKAVYSSADCEQDGTLAFVRRATDGSIESTSIFGHCQDTNDNSKDFATIPVKDNNGRSIFRNSLSTSAKLLTPVKILNSNFTNNADKVSVSSSIVLVLDSLIKFNEVNNIKLLKTAAEGSSISEIVSDVPISTMVSKDRIIITPNKPMNKGSTYSLLFPKSIIYEDQNTAFFLNNDFKLSFTTETAPKDVPTIKEVALTRTASNPLQFNIKASSSADNDLRFQFWAMDKEGWVLIKPFGDKGNNTCSWKPVSKENANYKLMVRIKDETNRICDEYIYVVKGSDLGYIKVTKLTSDSVNEGIGFAGTPVTLSAEASGSNSGLLFRFYASQGDDWILIRDYSPLNRAVWIPSKAGSYELKTQVKNNDVTDSRTFEATAAFEVLKQDYQYAELDCVVAKDSGKVNDIFNISALGKGDASTTLYYKFMIGEELRALNTMQNYTTVTNYNWKPEKSGVYKLFTFIKDKDSRDYEDGIYKYIKVTRPGVNITLNPLELSHTNFSQTVGTEMSFTALGNGSNNLEYSFWLFNDRGWHEVMPYSSNNTYKWKPARPGIYTILARVKDKDSGSYEDQRSVTYTIISDESTNFSINDLAVTGDSKRHIPKTITASASSSEELLYQFAAVDNLFGWKTLQQFSPLNSCTWLPKKAGSYRILVRVKSSSAGSYEQQKIVIYEVKN